MLTKHKEETTNVKVKLMPKRQNETSGFADAGNSLT